MEESKHVPTGSEACSERENQCLVLLTWSKSDAWAAIYSQWSNATIGFVVVVVVVVVVVWWLFVC